MTQPLDPRIIKRRHAKALGLNRYFTGKPCVHGHIAERVVSEAECVVCYRWRKRGRNNPARQKRRIDRIARLRAARDAHKAAYIALRDLGVKFTPPKPPPSVPIVMTRRDALALGFRKYFTGKPCKSGHLCERRLHGGCVECRRIDKKKRRAQSPRLGAKTEQKRRQRQRNKIAYLAVREILKQENANGFNAQ